MSLTMGFSEAELLNLAKAHPIDANFHQAIPPPAPKNQVGDYRGL